MNSVESGSGGRLLQEGGESDGAGSAAMEKALSEKDERKPPGEFRRKMMGWVIGCFGGDSARAEIRILDPVRLPCLASLRWLVFGAVPGCRRDLAFRGSHTEC